MEPSKSSPALAQTFPATYPTGPPTHAGKGSSFHSGLIPATCSPPSLPGWHLFLHGSTALPHRFPSVLPSTYDPFSMNKRVSCISHPQQQAFPSFSHTNIRSSFIHNTPNRKQFKCQSKRKQANCCAFTHTKGYSLIKGIHYWHTQQYE